MNNNLKIIVFDNFKEQGEKINKQLKIFFKTKEDFTIDIATPRFANGEGKGILLETVRGNDLYILADVGNYGSVYKLKNYTNHMSPDDHYQDIKRIVSVCKGYANKITLITPLLYQSRQDKRSSRESLDCAISLQELKTIGVDAFFTYDAHNPNVFNAIPLTPISNLYPTDVMAKEIVEKEKLDDNVVVISPDFGGAQRARHYAERLNCDVGIFYKRRDLTKIVNGTHPIIEHLYLGPDVFDKTIVVVDDIIASGNSLLEVANILKNKGAKKVILVATFALFTEELEKFDVSYQNGDFKKLYTTNLSYIPSEYLEKEYLSQIDLTTNIAEVIKTIHLGESLTKLEKSNSYVRK